MPSPPKTFVALLRGINVGGKNKLPMVDLVKVFEGAGARAVRTYIQSGNVVFEAAAAAAERMPARIAVAIEARFGLHVPVVMRRAEELAKVARDNPLLAAGADADTLHVAFLADRPGAAAVRALDPARSPGDTFVVQGRDVFLHLPNGVARSKLTNDWFDRQLATTSTIRNWRTVLALLGLTRA